MNFSKKHVKLNRMKRDAFLFGIYEIKRRNKVYLYCDMMQYAELKKVNKVWVKRGDI